MTIIPAHSQAVEGKEWLTEISRKKANKRT